jgi:hypothetical protein
MFVVKFVANFKHSPSQESCYYTVCLKKSEPFQIQISYNVLYSSLGWIALN